MIIQIVRYRSGLTHDDVASRFEARADRYRTVPGLLQKYYLHFETTGEHGGVYVWDSPESMQRWRDSNLADTLAETYQVQCSPDVEVADVEHVEDAGDVAPDLALPAALCHDALPVAESPRICRAHRDTATTRSTRLPRASSP